MGKCAKRDKIDNDVAIIVGFYMIFKAYFAPQLIKKLFEIHKKECICNHLYHHTHFMKSYRNF